MSNARRLRPSVRWLRFLLPLVAAVVVLVLRWPDSSSKSVDLAASGPQYSTVDQLVAASDLIVLGRIDRVEQGRVFTDSADPAAGIRTQLAGLAVEQVLKGPPTSSVTLEEEAALLDGTPITVDGAAPSTAGQRGVYFLIADDGDTAYYALIGTQGRYLIQGDSLVTAARDPLSTSLASSGLSGLLALL